MDLQLAEAINMLGEFCGKRDLKVLSRDYIKETIGTDQVDVLVLFGGSIIAGGDLLAQAIKDQVAKTYIIVGGAGHTTETLRQRVHTEYPDIETQGLSEAQVFSKYIGNVYGEKAHWLETQSTNCGNNITYLLELIREKQIPCQSIILCQDATMQYRMYAGMMKYVDSTVTVLNYATYHAVVSNDAEKLLYEQEIHGMWDMDRYVNLLMGEIPRLRDDENGYGPCGKNFISHIDIPDRVEEAFEYLKKIYGSDTRLANPLYASKG